MTLEQTSIRDFGSDTTDLQMEEQKLTTADPEECSFIIEDICTELSQIDTNEWEWHGDVNDETKFLTNGSGFETAREVHEILYRHTSNTPRRMRIPFAVYPGSRSNYHDYTFGNLYGCFGPIEMGIEYTTAGKFHIYLAGTGEKNISPGIIYIGPLDDGLHLIRSALQAYRTEDYYLIEKDDHLRKFGRISRTFITPSSGATD